MIIDTPNNVTNHLTSLKSAGVTTIIRYLNPLWPAGEKNIKAAEASAIASSGLKLGLVNEGWGDFAHGGISAGAGERDADYSLSAAEALGAKLNDACIYFAVDVDATENQIAALVIPYFEAITVFNNQNFGGNWLIGVYGSGAVCSAVHAAGFASRTWLSCSTGWLGSRAYNTSRKWALLQHLPSVLAGLDVDTNEANGPIGDFVPSIGAQQVALAKAATRKRRA